tara:strand:- start:89 stop:865 length:777 start_codon:yes stop_codon:yes gene_type:complete
MRKKKLFVVLAIYLILNARIAGAVAFDFSHWDALLKKYAYKGTKEGVHLTLVKYIFLKNDKQFKDLILKLEKFPVSDLNSHNEKLSFWVNVYNIFAIKIVADNYPLKSIKDVGGFFNQVWDKEAGVIGGNPYSLNDIEHGILRKMGEPHIHAAIVCASVSCANLAVYSYKPDIITSQLDNQMEELLANETKGFKVNNDEETVYISSIFKWFRKDFKKHGGVINCLKMHAPVEMKQYLKHVESGDYSIEYFDFNWNVNE